MSISKSLFGICHLSIVPVRATPSDKAEMTTQVLFGEIFSIIEISENEKWIKIELAHDQYQGWLDAKQYRPISEEYFSDYKAIVHPCTRQGITVVAFPNVSFPIVGGSLLPFLNENSEVNLDFAAAEVLSDLNDLIPATGLESWVLDYAYSYLSAPYLWGGRTFFGIDCSGYVQQIYRQMNIEIPRDASQQATVGWSVSFTEAKPGDLAFFKNEEGRVTHVGMVLDHGEIIHASGEVRIDILDEKGIFNRQKERYSHSLASIKRLIA